MVLDTVVYNGMTLGGILAVSGIVLGGAAVYLFLQKDEWVMKFNEIIDSTADKAGASKDKGYDEEEMRGKLMKALENDEQDRSDLEKQMTMDHVMKEVEAIQSQAKALGRQEERMKGEDSDSVYNLLVINMFMTGVLLLGFVWINFM